MPMDEYDSAHRGDFDAVINVYDNSDIDAVVQNFTKNMSECQEIELLQRNIRDTINKLTGALDVLDYRTITCIGARVSHIYRIEENTHNNWYLVNVWRSRYF